MENCPLMVAKDAIRKFSEKLHAECHSSSGPFFTRVALENVLKTLLRALDDEKPAEVCEGPEKGDSDRLTATQKQLQVKDLEIRQLREANLDLADAVETLKNQIQAQTDYALECHRGWTAREKELEAQLEREKRTALSYYGAADYWRKRCTDALNKSTKIV